MGMIPLRAVRKPRVSEPTKPSPQRPWTTRASPPSRRAPRVPLCASERACDRSARGSMQPWRARALRRCHIPSVACAAGYLPTTVSARPTPAGPSQCAGRAARIMGDWPAQKTTQPEGRMPGRAARIMGD
jgi:hypothetical protein